MKQSNKTHFVNLLTYIIVFLILAMVVTSVLYYIPRKTVVVNSFQTTQKVYTTGDLVVVRINVSSSTYSTTNNSLYLKCGNTLYGLKQIRNDIYPTETIDLVVNAGVIPRDVFPPDCSIYSKLLITYKILPFFERTVQQDIHSNQFKVINKEK